MSSRVARRLDETLPRSFSSWKASLRAAVTGAGRKKRLTLVLQIQRQLEEDVAKPVLGWRNDYFAAGRA